MPARRKNRGSGETTTIVDTAKRLDIGVNQAYEAAKRGEISVLWVGRRMLVPTAWIDRVLAGEPAPELLLPISERRKAKRVRSSQPSEATT